MQRLNKAFLLAAGLGTRLRPFTEQVAKPAIPFVGLPQILYPYYFAKQMGVTNFAYNTHHLPQTLNQVFKDYKITATEFHESKLLDSAGGLGNTKSFFKNETHFLMINADSLFVYQNLDPIYEAFEKHLKRKAIATLSVIDQPGVGVDFSGLWYDSKGHLKGGGLKDKTQFNCHHFIGIYIFSNEIFNYVSTKPVNIIYDVLVPLSLEQNNVYVEFLNWKWFELGKLADFQKNYHEVIKLCETGKFNEQSSFVKTQRHFDPNWNIKNFKPGDFESQILKY